MAAAGAASPHMSGWFARFFGPAPPVLCIGGLSLLALFVAPSLKRLGWWGVPRFEALPVGLLLLGGFTVSVTVADRLIGFPRDTNAPLPWSLLYYPAMGFAAQIGLHLIPLAAIVMSASRFAVTRPWMTAAAASVPEAALQAIVGEGPAAPFVIMHLMFFGMAELYLLRRFGIVAMYLFRLGYYLWWHILWPAWR